MGLLETLASWLTGDIHVPIVPIMSREEAKFGQDYRHPDDPPGTIRVKQAKPEGLSKKFASFIKVADISHRQANALAFFKGANRYLELEWKSSKRGNQNAIKVIGCWHDHSGHEYREQLGWVPAIVAKDIPAGIPLCARIDSMYEPLSDETRELRIDVWGPRYYKRNH